MIDKWFPLCAEFRLIFNECSSLLKNWVGVGYRMLPAWYSLYASKAADLLRHLTSGYQWNRNSCSTSAEQAIELRPCCRSSLCGRPPGRSTKNIAPFECYAVASSRSRRCSNPGKAGVALISLTTDNWRLTTACSAMTLAPARTAAFAAWRPRGSWRRLPRPSWSSPRAGSSTRQALHWRALSATCHATG